MKKATFREFWYFRKKAQYLSKRKVGGRLKVSGTGAQNCCLRLVPGTLFVFLPD